LLAALCLGAAPGEPAAAAPGAVLGEKTLEDVMQGLKEKLKQLSAALEGKKQQDALVAVGEMQRLVQLAKTHEPKNLNDTPKAGRPAQVVAFRKDLIGMLRELADVEVEVLDEQYDAALAKVNGQVIQMRDAGHKKYKEGGGGR
jgi:molybdopterin converting factor small subunit